MPFLFFAAIALIGAAVHLRRDHQPRSRARTLEIFLVRSNRLRAASR
jgi:hypothetical protein